MRIIYTLVGLITVCVVGISSQCPPNALDQFVQCLRMIFPHPKDHPRHAPIIGGGNIEYARDMCFSTEGDDFSWKKGVECVIDIEEKCLGAKAGQIIKGLFNKDRFEAAMNKFCSDERMDAYEYNSQCYTDQREGLAICKIKEAYDIVTKIAAKPNMTVSEYLYTFCSTRDWCVVCQDEFIRSQCGKAAADPIYDIMYDLRGPGCNAALIHVNVMFVLMAILTAIVGSW